MKIPRSLLCLTAVYALSTYAGAGIGYPAYAARHLSSEHKTGTAKTYHRQTGSSASTSNYLGELKMGIASNWSPPRAKTSTWGVVYFELDSHGNCHTIKLVKSSNSKQIDKSFIDCIEAAAPYGNLPQGMTKMGFNAAFHYYPETQSKSLIEKLSREQQDYIENLEQNNSKSTTAGARIPTFSTVCTFIDSSEAR